MRLCDRSAATPSEKSIGMGRVALLLGAAAMILTMALPSAWAADCIRSCSGGKKVCAIEAKAAVKACKEACRANGISSTCFRTCKTAFKAARAACKTALAECRPDCPPPDSDTFPCVDSCGSLGRGCFRSLVDRGRECVRACRNAGRPGLFGCLRDCADELHGGLASCKDTIRQCRIDCEPPPGPPPADCVAGCLAGARPCFEAAAPIFKECSRDCLAGGWPGFLGCVKGCAGGMCACALDLKACLAGCDGSAGGAFPGLPGVGFCGSPSGAFVDAAGVSPSLLP